MPNKPLTTPTSPHESQAAYATIPPEALRDHIVSALDDTKAEDIEVLDVRGQTDIADFMVICSGTSDRHVQAIARNAQDTLAAQGIKPMSTEGEEQSDWVLADYIDVLVHIMKRETRDFYDLASLWSEKLAKPAKEDES